MNETLDTSDTDFAAAVVASGVPIESMHRRNDGRVFFAFKKELRTAQLEKRYWTKDLPIDAQTLLKEWKTLKHRISDLY